MDDTICEFLHCFWIENPLLIRLVHFQGYQISLLNTTVNKIGSIICTWDFLVDLIDTGKFKQKLFALYLAGELGCAYPTQMMLDIIRTCIQYIEDNLPIFSDEHELISILKLYTTAFPQLKGRVKRVNSKAQKPYFNYSNIDKGLFR